MRRPAELDDADRDPMRRMQEVGEEQARILSQMVRETRDAMRPMGASKRLPSPYTQAPRPVKAESSAPIAFACFALLGSLLTFIGGAQVARWIWEAVR